MSIVTIEKKEGYILKGAYGEGKLQLYLTNFLDGTQFELELTNSGIDEYMQQYFPTALEIWNTLT